VKAPGDLGRVGRFEEQRERLDQISPRLLNRRALTGDIKFGAQGNETVVLAFDNRVKRRADFNDPSLHEAHHS